MNTKTNDIEKWWADSRKNMEGHIPSADQIISHAKIKRRNTLNAQYGNIAILSAVLFVVALFLYELYPIPDPLNQWGTHMMVASLAIRIIIELISVVKSRKIDVTGVALKTTENTVKLYEFRNRIHGPVTIAMVVLYTLGFFMYVYGLGKYLDLIWLILLYGFYIIGAGFLIWAIRKGIKREMNDLMELIHLRQEIIREN